MVKIQLDHGGKIVWFPMLNATLFLRYEIWNIWSKNILVWDLVLIWFFFKEVSISIIKWYKFLGWFFHYFYLTLKKTINKKSNQLYIKKYTNFCDDCFIILILPLKKTTNKKVTTNYDLLFFNKCLYNKTN
jgi:hypothetical protein